MNEALWPGVMKVHLDSLAAYKPGLSFEPEYMWVRLSMLGITICSNSCFRPN